MGIEKQPTEGQVVVVTGAGGGIGCATARAFGARGAQVGLLARGQTGLSAAVRDVETVGGEAVSLSVDVTDPDQVEQAAADVEAQPVPPIYQPEVAAHAVIYAADHPRRREYWVGGSTMGTLAANQVAAGFLDRYLARTGYKSQQTDQPRSPAQPVNLWEPADGESGRDFGAHGIFDAKSTDRSCQLWASRHHGLIGKVAAGALAAGVGMAARWIRR